MIQKIPDREIKFECAKSDLVDGYPTNPEAYQEHVKMYAHEEVDGKLKLVAIFKITTVSGSKKWTKLGGA